MYFNFDRDDKTGKKLFTSTVIPNRGAWLEYEMDVNDVMYVRIDKTRKLPVTTLVRALGIADNKSMTELLGESDILAATLEKDITIDVDHALTEVYYKLRPGEPEWVVISTTKSLRLLYVLTV